MKKIENTQNRLPDDLRAQKVIFVITTDGLENSSREYTAKMVRKMIKTHQKQGWQFIFMGANMDAVTEAGRLGISRRHAVSYRNDAKGVALNYAVTGGILSMMRDSSRSVEDIDEELDDAFEPIRRHLEK